MIENPEIKIQTTKAFAPPSGLHKQVSATDFLNNGGEIRGKYVWTLKGGWLGVAFDAVIEEDSSYCIIFAMMNDVSGRFCINSEYVKISN
mgnify:CR=1 FL=1